MGINENRSANCMNSLRLIAAAIVLLSHCYPLSGDFQEPLAVATKGMLNFGMIGVFVFFTISGYLISQSAARQDSVLKFFEARSLRIFPALWVCLLVSVLATSFISTLPAAEFFAHPQTFEYLRSNFRLDIHFELPGVFAKNPYPAAVNGSLWTLPVEFALYILVAGLLFFDIIKHRAATMVALLMLIALWLKGESGIAPLLPGVWATPEYAYAILSFLNGMVLFLFADKIRINLFGALSLFVLCVLCRHSAWFMASFCVFFSYLVIWLANGVQRDLSSWISRNDISYGLYLYAFPIQQLLALNEHFRMKPLALMMASLPITLIVAFISWKLVEQPALAQKGRIMTFFLNVGRRLNTRIVAGK